MTIHNVTPAEVQARIASGEAVDLIDVSTTTEWFGGHAAAARHVPLGQLDPALIVSQRKGKPEDPIYLISASDERSASACKTMHQAGVTQAVHVAGGTAAWSRAGLPIERTLTAASMGLVKQVAIMGLAATVVLLLMPCSPISVWGSAFCATTPVASSPDSTGQPSDSLDFNRDVIRASATVPVLVDFHATWCPPCKLLDPEIAAVAKERGDRLRVIRIDVDQHGSIAQSQDVSGIPDIRLWMGGKEVARFVGFRPKAEIMTWIDQATTTR